MTPDAAGRVAGTTYPSDRAPAGSEPLRDRAPSLRERIAARLLPLAARAGVFMLRPQPGDVLVVRTPNRGPAMRESSALGDAWRKAGGSVVVVLPLDCRVHAEPARLATEDRGYRETQTYGKDRGVHVGVPGAPDTTSPPHDGHGRSEAR
jgi:hypothetical protein